MSPSVSFLIGCMACYVEKHRNSGCTKEDVCQESKYVLPDRTYALLRLKAHKMECCVLTLLK